MDLKKYNNWKKKQKAGIYVNESIPYRTTILKFTLDGITPKAILQYLHEFEDLTEKKAKKIYLKVINWASIPNIFLIKGKNKIEIYHQLLQFWANKQEITNHLEDIKLWTPIGNIDFNYNKIKQDATKSPKQETKAQKESEIEIKPKPKVNDILSKGQTKALNEFYNNYNCMQMAKEFGSGFKPRTNTLIAGPSGSGKTYLASKFAEKLGIPFLTVTVSSWLLLGSKTSPQNLTLGQIAKFVAENPNGIIYLDEIDKINGKSDWSNHLRLEVHTVLDKQFEITIKEALSQIFETAISNEMINQLSHKFKNEFYIIGGGTWQDFWEQKTKPTLGFNNQESEEQLDKEKLTQSITPELLQRFQQDIVVIEPLTITEYKELAQSVVKNIESDKIKESGFIDNFLKQVDKGSELAEKNKIGMRYIQECITKALKESVKNVQD